MTGITTNTGRAFTNTTQLALQNLKSGTVARLITGERYAVLTTNSGDGVLLANGNYANLISEATRWKQKTANFTSVARESNEVDASANAVNISLPVLIAGDVFTYHNSITSTNKVQILNPTQFIMGKGGNILAGNNMEIEAGQSVQLVAKSTTALSIVGALV
jgi:hypothetical protein